MALILSIDTSTKVCSVALHREGNLIAFSQYFMEKSHSSILTNLIAEVVRNSSHEMKDINAVAISEGPGSYTGLRIGTSTAKGICFALDVPLIAVSTLMSMCRGVARSNYRKSLLCPMIDARRMEVYSLICNHELQIVKDISPMIIDEQSFEDLLSKQEILFFGDGSEKCQPVIGGSKNAVFLPDVHPSARDIGDLGWAKYQNNEFADLAYFEPFYLKAFRAGKPKQLV